MGVVENLLISSFGEPSSKLKVTYKKTVKVREYETEVIEATNELNIEETLSNAERLLIQAMLKCQMEYMVYSDLYIRGTVTEKEFMDKKEEIESTLITFKNKCNQVGINTDKYLNLGEL